MKDWEKSKEQLIDELVALRQQVTKLEQAETEHHQTELALRASKARLAGILDIAIEAVISTDEQQRIMLFNKGAETLFGYSAKEVTGKSLDMLIPERVQEIHRQHIQTFQGSEVTARPMAERSEPYGMRKSGEEFPIEASISRLSINEDTVFTVVLRDITEPKLREETLRSSESRLRLLLEQRNQELEILLAASQQMIGEINIDDLLTSVTKSIVSTLPHAEAASLWLYDEEKDTLVARAWESYPDEAMSELSIPSERGIAGLVYRSGTVHHFADVQNEAVYESFAHSALNHIHSSLGVPLRSSHQVLGVLFADSFSRTAAFNEEDKRLLLGLAVQISMVIQNVQLFEQLIAEREQTRQLAQQVLVAQENERKRVSRELHDEAGQALILLKQGLQQVQREIAGDFERVHQRLGDSIALSDQMMERVRGLAYNLRPPLLDTMGLSVVLEEYCQEFVERTGVGVEYSGTELPALPDTVRITLYRFLQEALTNVVKHAAADRIHVILDYTNDTVSLSIEDNGDGFDSHIEMRSTRQQKGIGLVGLQERVRAVNGRLDVVSEPGNGTQLTVYIPVENKA